MKLKKKEYDAKMEELRNKINEAKTNEELDSLEMEKRKLEMQGYEEESSTVEITPEEERKLIKNTEDTKVEERNLVKVDINKEERKVDEETQKLEERGTKLKEGKKIAVDFESRATTVSSGDLLVPKKYKNEIDESFLAVSGIVSQANYINLNGGDSYSVPFEKGYGEGEYTSEGADYAETDPDVDYVETGRAKITAYSEITKEAVKLPNANYQALVIKRVKDAILKKLGRQMVIGAGTTNTIKGIYNSDVKVMPGLSDIELSKIDTDTLNNITFAYGGDEAVELEQTLLLSKTDLQDFSKVRTTDGKFVYKITKNGTAGTITYAEGGLAVNYIINSAINPLSTATEGQFTMIYGSLNSYELPVFSQLEIEESRDYKFKQGVIAYRGDVIVGGTVSKYNGFVRVKKELVV